MRRPVPYNYPVEGARNAVAAEELQEREHRKWDDHSPVEYMVNAGQDNETIVRTTVSAQRQASIDLGHRILRQASNDLGASLESAARKPLSVDFDLIRKEAQEDLDAESRARSQAQEETR